MTSERLNRDATIYGFDGVLFREFPSQIIVDISEACNLACTHCPHPSFKKSPHYAARKLDPALNAKLVEEVRERGQGYTGYIRYTSNGEPLLHPQACDMIEDAVRRSGVFVTLTTNGMFLDENRARRLLSVGLHMVDISIDAFEPETYAKIRVNGELERTRSNVRRFISLSKEMKARTKTVVSFVEQPANVAECARFEAYWLDQGVKSVVFRRMHSHSGALNAESQALHSMKKSAHRRPCLYPWERIVLNAQGHLMFCPSDWVHGSFVADFQTTSVIDAWRGPFYEKLRQAHITNNFAGHQFCGKCPDWRETRWPNNGRRYADLVAEFVEEKMEP